jgi:radical SAM superfamily enzyme YgiQ (UPF0313 family)
MRGDPTPLIGTKEATARAFLDRKFPDGRLERVLLVTPPDADAHIFQFATARRGRYTNYPPYGLAVLGRHLEIAGVRSSICNLNHEVLRACHQSDSADDFDFDATWQGHLDAAIAEFKPDLIAVTCMFTMTHGAFAQVCERAADSGVPVAIGGVHVSNDTDRVLDDIPGAAFAFVREADTSLVNFVHVVRGDADIPALGQVVLNDTDGPLVSRIAFEGECQPDADAISVIPDYDLVDLGAYSDYGTVGAFYCFKGPDTKFATVLSNRGCRAQCTFCSVRNFNGVGVRQRSVASVLDELEILERDHGIGHIMWLDDDLFKDHARAIALFEGMVERGLTMTWDATNGVLASSCTDEVIEAAANSGCIAVNIGMESGNREILKSVRKPGTVETFLRAAEVLAKYPQIHTSVFLMIGFPGETLAQIKDTIDVAKQMGMDWYRISPLSPLPNTPIYDSMVAQGVVSKGDASEVRFMAGAYGKQAEIEQGIRKARLGFAEAFAAIPMDAVPTDDQITDIWFYMNYHLNFHRLFTETNPVKVDQQMKVLRNLGDMVAPENGFALYFLAYLQIRNGEAPEDGLLERLHDRLSSSPYWRDRFEAFGLSAEDFIDGNFSGNRAPVLAFGAAAE